MKGWILAIAVATFVASADAGTFRCATAKAEFKRLRPCPATGQARGPCPGYVVDHIIPLCAGGPDRPDNMQ